MKRLLHTFTLLAAVAATIIAPSCRRGEQAELRLMSYNVRNCRGLDDSVSYERIASIITDANADAVAIQELDSMTTRYPQQDVLGNLAALTGMYPTYAPSIDYAGGKYGIDIDSRNIGRNLWNSPAAIIIPRRLYRKSQNRHIFIIRGFRNR